MKRITFAVIGGLVALLIASPASATDAKVCPDWTLRSIVQEWGPAADGSTVVDAHTVKLVKPEGGGTEFAAKGVDLAGTVTVDYALSDGASYEAGAVRLFIYESADADTLTDVPTAFVAATADSGTLTIPDAEAVGTLGVVYDASNAAGGVVTFSNLTVGGVELSFTGTCASASASPTASPSASSSASSSPAASATSSATSNPGVAGDVPTLPKTGAKATDLVLIGAIGILAGIGVVALVARRRRHRFEA